MTASEALNESIARAEAVLEECYDVEASVEIAPLTQLCFLGPDGDKTLQILHVDSSSGLVGLVPLYDVPLDVRIAAIGFLHALRDRLDEETERELERVRGATRFLREFLETEIPW